MGSPPLDPSSLPTNAPKGESGAVGNPGQRTLSIGTALPDGSGQPNVYRIERFIAQGGHADIYLCTVNDPAYRDDILVLKINGSKFRIPNFFREALWQAQPGSMRGIVPCMWCDHTVIDGEPTAVYVMPYLREGTLVSRLERRDYTYLDCVNWIYGVADSLEQLPVVHRDLKPENIMLYGGRAMVADFGLAVHADAATRAQWGEEVREAGTPNYMSPEQFIASRFKELDVRADIYSLTLVFYEMWTGRLPFPDSMPWDKMRDLKTLDEPILDDLGHQQANAFVHKNLSRQRIKRCQTWAEFKVELAGIRNGLLSFGNK
jgi:serine/threonine-protein kinase